VVGKPYLALKSKWKLETPMKTVMCNTRGLNSGVYEGVLINECVPENESK
jgi:hypothetical protein